MRTTATFEQYILEPFARAAAPRQTELAISARAAYQSLMWDGAHLVALDGPVPLLRGRFLVRGATAADDDRAAAVVRAWRARGVDASYVVGGLAAWRAAGLPA